MEMDHWMNALCFKKLPFHLIELKNSSSRILKSDWHKITSQNVGAVEQFHKVWRPHAARIWVWSSPGGGVGPSDPGQPSIPQAEIHYMCCAFRFQIHVPFRIDKDLSMEMTEEYKQRMNFWRNITKTFHLWSDIYTLQYRLLIVFVLTLIFQCEIERNCEKLLYN